MLPPAHRLSTSDLTATMRTGRRAGSSAAVLYGRLTESHDAPRFAIICGKKIGNAPTRNRVRRQYREIARLRLVPLADPGAQVVIRALPGGSKLDYAGKATETIRLLSRLGVTTQQLAGGQGDFGTPDISASSKQVG